MSRLICHPETPPLAVERVEAQLIRLPAAGASTGALLARYRITGIGRLVMPAFTGRGREDGLWKHSCAELFLAPETPGYREYNFAPTGRWAAYDFRDYRKPAGEYEPLEIPEISVRTGDTMAVLDARLNPREITGFVRANLSMVIEEEGGHLSYWALAHPGERPDFHHPDSFLHQIEPA
jgi:hypothetical protein